MLTPITTAQARELYKSATQACQYTAFNGTIVTAFESRSLYIIVNDFGYRKEAFTQPREDLVDDVFSFNAEEDNYNKLI